MVKIVKGVMLMARLSIFLLSLLFVFCSLCKAVVVFNSDWKGKVSPLDTKNMLRYYKEKYLSFLNSQKPDLGFYFITTYEKDFESGENRYLYGIEWRLFDEGLWQSKREKMKKILQTKLEFLQLRREDLNRRIVLTRQHIHFVHNRLLLQKAKNKVKLLKKILKRRIEALKAGFTTKADVEHLRLKLERAKRMVNVLEDAPKEKLSNYEWELLNCIEFTPLMSKKDLLKIAVRHRPEIRIQDVFADRAEFFPSWTDDLDVTLYVVRKNEFYPRDRWVYGARVAVPLYYNRKRGKIVEIQRLLYMEHKRLIKAQIKREIELRLYRFKMAQLKVLEAEKEYEMIKQELKDTEEKVKAPIQNLEKEPLRILEDLQIRLLDAMYSVLENRLRAYMYLVDILETCGVLDPKAILATY